MERDEGAIEVRKKEVWPVVELRPRPPGRIVFEHESVCLLRPLKAKTWGRRGRTPVVTVRGRGSGRVSIAELTCYQPKRKIEVPRAAQNAQASQGSLINTSSTRAGSTGPV